MDDNKGIPHEKIISYLGTHMTADLKNHHRIKGTMVFYHLTEQMIHFSDWVETDSTDKVIRQGKYIVINRTAWFQLYC